MTQLTTQMRILAAVEPVDPAAPGLPPHSRKRAFVWTTLPRIIGDSIWSV